MKSTPNQKHRSLATALEIIMWPWTQETLEPDDVPWEKLVKQFMAEVRRRDKAKRKGKSGLVKVKAYASIGSHGKIFRFEAGPVGDRYPTLMHVYAEKVSYDLIPVTITYAWPPIEAANGDDKAKETE